jgi:hypothetical protein
LEVLPHAELIALVRAQAALLAEQAGELERLRRDNAGLREDNARLGARLARLERLVSRNSRNSGTPPSKDDDLGRTPPRMMNRSPTGEQPRKRGKRKGAPGAQLAWSPDPDDTIDHHPQGLCPCGADLADAVALGVGARHRQVDVAAVAARVTQHDRHAARCSCGRVHLAQRPEGVADTTVSYRPNLVSWCVYLMVAHAIPVARCADLVHALIGTRPSDGFVHGLIGRAATAVAEANQIIRTLLTLPMWWPATRPRCG